MDRQVLPRNNEFERLAASGVYPTAVVEPLKKLAREAGLWNMFLPGLKGDEPGTRMTNMQYAPLAEIMGRLPWASEVFNSNAPDTGNMELLHLFATPDQRERWLKPLMEGTIRSCFSMTEPDVARKWVSSRGSTPIPNCWCDAGAPTSSASSLRPNIRWPPNASRCRAWRPPPGSCASRGRARDASDQWLIRNLSQVTLELELGSNEAVKRAVASGLGLGCLSRLAVEDAVANGWLVS